MSALPAPRGRQKIARGVSPWIRVSLAEEPSKEQREQGNSREQAPPCSLHRIGQHKAPIAKWHKYRRLLPSGSQGRAAKRRFGDPGGPNSPDCIRRRRQQSVVSNFVLRAWNFCRLGSAGTGAVIAGREELFYQVFYFTNGFILDCCDLGDDQLTGTVKHLLFTK